MDGPTIPGAGARFSAAAKVVSRSRKFSDKTVESPAEVFATRTFDRRARRQYLPRKVFDRLEEVIERRERLDPETAAAVAHGMKDWALAHGASHFCHWFQPQTGLTAEKHDSFLSFDDRSTPLERFSGSQLFQGEPDASSFPSGGSRSTFEARGYTMWDPTSPVFLVEVDSGSTLCIPCHFLSHDGQALDEKTPLIRSMQLLAARSRQALEIITGKSVDIRPQAGVEQEYFLVDEALAHLRPDLILSGRTLLGARPAKGQELDDHYFGTIKERVLRCMQSIDHELMRLGVPVKTRHNEVAPMQFELAPLHEECHLAADHNQLIMARGKAIAQRHGFRMLLHEKPFHGLNGSGKHINWSIITTEGENLFEPGETPSANLRFLFFLCAFLEGARLRGELLRACVASAGNDHRLGANEAPPAVMSVYLGNALSKVLEDVSARRKPSGASSGKTLNLGLNHLCELPRDTTDRNRTSPLAFTGNKFEFRAAGSSQSIGLPLAVLNGMTAEGLDLLLNELGGNRDDEATLKVLRKSIKRTAVVRFEGNCYSSDWSREAGKRGLSRLADTPSSLKLFSKKTHVAFLSDNGILTEAETESRRRVRLEQYVKTIEIECACLDDMAKTQVLPALFAHRLYIPGVGGNGLRVRSQPRTAFGRYSADVDKTIHGIMSAIEHLDQLRERAGRSKTTERHAMALAHRVLPAMSKLRALCDHAENLVCDSLWPLPKYRELLFLC